jgi:hypothetical protein
VDGRDRRLAQSSGQYQVQRGRLKNEEQLETPETVIARYAAQISLWALWISGGALFVAVCAFILELRRRFDEGVRLSVNIMPRAKLFGGVQDANTYLSVIVTNRGSAPTTITHFLLFYYPNQLALYLPRWSGRWLKWLRPRPSFIANTGTPGPIPYFLELGKNWFGMATYTPDLEQMIQSGRLCVGIVGSHSDKTLFKRVRPWKVPEDAKSI